MRKTRRLSVFRARIAGRFVQCSMDFNFDNHQQTSAPRRSVRNCHRSNSGRGKAVFCNDFCMERRRLGQAGCGLAGRSGAYVAACAKKGEDGEASKMKLRKELAFVRCAFYKRHTLARGGAAR
jgi:hypothetical protein